MAYNPNSGYGQSNPYGGQSGGYGQSNPYASSTPYGAQPRNDNPPPQYRPTQNNMADVEMQPIGGQHNPFDDPRYRYGGNPHAGQDPNAILNDCREVGKAIDDLEARLQELQRVQRSFVIGNGATNKEIDAKGADIMAGYRALADRVRKIKSRPEARETKNEAQVGALDRRIKRAINQFQQTESGFRREVQEQQRRQYLIVRPEATEAEIRQATEAGGDTQIFQQALLNADRRGQASSTLRNVQQRHDAIQQIERTMMELAELFQDLDTMVVQQEPLIQEIEKHAEETHDHMVEANVHLESANNSARAARKKKWICLGIVLAIIAIVIIVVLIYLKVTGVLK